jgi:hypothetical protein
MKNTIKTHPIFTDYIRDYIYSSYLTAEDVKSIFESIRLTQYIYTPVSTSNPGIIKAHYQLSFMIIISIYNICSAVAFANDTTLQAKYTDQYINRFINDKTNLNLYTKNFPRMINGLNNIGIVQLLNPYPQYRHKIFIINYTQRSYPANGIIYTELIDNRQRSNDEYQKVLDTYKSMLTNNIIVENASNTFCNRGATSDVGLASQNGDVRLYSRDQCNSLGGILADQNTGSTIILNNVTYRECFNPISGDSYSSYCSYLNMPYPAPTITIPAVSTMAPCPARAPSPSRVGGALAYKYLMNPEPMPRGGKRKTRKVKRV